MDRLDCKSRFGRHQIVCDSPGKRGAYIENDQVLVFRHLPNRERLGSGSDSNNGARIREEVASPQLSLESNVGL